MSMIGLDTLFEGHLTVGDLQRSMEFFGGVLGLELAHVVQEPKAAFYWIGNRGKTMLGLWEAQAPQKLSLHLAFGVTLEDVLRAPGILRAAGIEPRDFWGNPADEPDVLGWMPAASVFFHDPDGNLLEFLSMLPDAPAPDLGIVSWSRWAKRGA